MYFVAFDANPVSKKESGLIEDLSACTVICISLTML